jgi:hypothetical protein
LGKKQVQCKEGKVLQILQFRITLNFNHPETTFDQANIESEVQASQTKQEKQITLTIIEQMKKRDKPPTNKKTCGMQR